MKKVLSVFTAVLIIALSLVTFASAVNYPNPTNEFFVNDFASVISPENKEKMQAQGEALYKKSGAQVVVATVKSLDGTDIESYSLELARKWGIGDEEKDNGVLLLLAVSERKVRIEVGYGLEGALPDSKTGRILDAYGIEHFSEDDFSTGLAEVYNSLVNEVYIEYGLEPDEDYEQVSETAGEMNSFEAICVIVIFLIIIFASIFSSKKRRGRRVFFGPIYHNYHDDDDTFFGGHSGGGFSGGGFSGGGGSFGGGGSSRGF